MIPAFYEPFFDVVMMKGFIEFIREQGVVGLTIGFILGGSLSSFVASFVKDVVNPFIGLMMRSVGNLAEYKIILYQTEDGQEAALMIGNFISSFINLLIVAALVYFVFKGLRLDRLDKKKT